MTGRLPRSATRELARTLDMCRGVALRLIEVESGSCQGDERIAADHRRWIDTLERLLAIPTTDVRLALGGAGDLVAGALHADKVDPFLYESERDTLIAVGTSAQPLSETERRHGLDVWRWPTAGRWSR